MKLVTFKCNDSVILDLYDTERVPAVTTDAKYFLTPRRLALIEKWKIENKIQDKIQSQEHLDFFVQQGWLGKYTG